VGYAGTQIGSQPLRRLANLFLAQISHFGPAPVLFEFFDDLKDCKLVPTCLIPLNSYRATPLELGSFILHLDGRTPS
jgi:hypothetical protein